MKNSIPTLAVAFFLLVFAGFTSCESPQKKVDDAQSEVEAANKALEVANAEYIAEVEAYRQEKAVAIAANDSTIVAVRLRMANEKKNVKADYEKTIADLEQRNRVLKAKMDNYNDEGKERWESFKQEFNRDMDELGTALKDLTVDNKK